MPSSPFQLVPSSPARARGCAGRRCVSADASRPRRTHGSVTDRAEASRRQESEGTALRRRKHVHGHAESLPRLMYRHVFEVAPLAAAEGRDPLSIVALEPLPKCDGGIGRTDVSATRHARLGARSRISRPRSARFGSATWRGRGSVLAHPLPGSARCCGRWTYGSPRVSPTVFCTSSLCGARVSASGNTQPMHNREAPLIQPPRSIT
jgi:hypothetical protein